MFSSRSALVVTEFVPFATWLIPVTRLFPLYLTGRVGCPGDRPGLPRAEIAELGRALVGQRVREPVQDGDGLPPGRAGAVPVALGQQGVAKPAQRVALAERRADLPVSLDGLGVVRLGL